MIKANELRIGNWVEAIAKMGNYPIQILPLHIEAINNNPECANAIPLTPEWLERCGFKYRDGADAYGTYRNNYVELYEHDENPGIFHYTMGLFRGAKKEINYVHELQNLYFALIGEELIIKQSHDSQ